MPTQGEILANFNQAALEFALSAPRDEVGNLTPQATLMLCEMMFLTDNEDELKRMQAQDYPVVRKDDEQQTKNEPKLPTIPKSPFANRKSLYYFSKAICKQGERSDLTGCTPASDDVEQKPTQGGEQSSPPQSSGDSPSSWPGISEKVKEQILSRLPARYDREEISKIASEIIEGNLRQRKENPDKFFSTDNEDIARWAVGEAAERLRSTIRDREKEKYKALREAQLSRDVPPPKGFPGSKAQIKVVSKRDPEKIKAMLSATFGREMELQQVADLVGAPDDAVVSITPGKARDSFTIRVKHLQYAAKRTIYKDEGKVVIHNDEFFMKEGQTGTGLGTEVLAKQIDNARSLGVAYLECHAGGPPMMNGYYTWPRFGYDQDLKGVFTGFAFDSDLKEKYEEIQRRFVGAETVGDIMLTEEGREWWKKNGVRMHNAKFDLGENSRSLKIFSAYLDERKGRKEGKKSMPDSDLLRGEIDDVGNGEEELPLSKQDEEALDLAWQKIDSKKPKLPTVPKSPFRPKE